MKSVTGTLKRFWNDSGCPSTPKYFINNNFEQRVHEGATLLKVQGRPSTLVVPFINHTYDAGTKLLLVGQLVQGHEPYLRSLQRWVLEHGLSQARGEESSGEIHPRE